MTYTRVPAASASPWTRVPGGGDHVTTMPCIFSGGHPAEATFIEHEGGQALFIKLYHDETVHELMITAPPDATAVALWTALSLIAPVGGWRMPTDELVLARQALANGETGTDDIRLGSRHVPSDAGLVTAIRSTLINAVALVWNEQGLNSVWVVSGEMSDSAAEATVAVQADDHHTDIWTATSGALAASIGQRLERCGGTVTLDGRTHTSSESVGDLIRALGESLAT